MTDDAPPITDDPRAPARAARRGRLRIFFGAAAGVGKTSAMLAQAAA
ncbi:MAG TPA: hypothetical protein VF457_05520, partial [Burkholderiaceae bacterium]